MPDLRHGIETLLILLLVVVAVAIAVHKLRVPYTIALVLTGLLGFQPGFRQVALTPDLILVLFLPVLLFEGAYNVSARGLQRDVVPIALLAVPGVLLGTLVTGSLVHLMLGIGWAESFVFGALISSTDPIAVLAMFKELKVPHRLALQVEGESLFNDGTSITLFLILLPLSLGGSLKVAQGLFQFCWTALGAMALGTLIGVLGSRALRLIDAPAIQITISVIAAYGTYLLAEQFAFSGAIAVVVTGLLFGNYGSTRGVNPSAVIALNATWDFLGFLANSLVFLLIGISLNRLTLLQEGAVIGAAFLAVVIGRICVVYLCTPFLRGRYHVPRVFRPVLVWGGLRGAVSLALAFSIPAALPDGQPFPDHALIQTLAFGVVAVSLLLQGLTMPPLLRRLGLTQANEGSSETAVVQARLHAIEGAIAALSQAHDAAEIEGLPYQRLVNAYRLEYDALQQQIAEETQHE